MEAMVAHLRAAAPCEGCGLLATTRAAAGTAVVRRFYPGTNLDASPTRYTMDPVEVISALIDMEARGWELGAIVHSHLTTPPTPSPTDLREAYYPEALMLIVSLATEPATVRAWHIEPTPARPTVTEVPIEIEPFG
jgi:proteasome lid subunit RPN8/RPN11